jgi:hypothetical protein
MEENIEATGRVIGNVGVLDLRKATKETVATIARVGNVGVMLVSPDTVALAGSIAVGNLGAVIEAPADARLINGQEVIGQDYFKNVTEPVDLIVIGSLYIEPEVSVDDIEKGMGSLAGNGKLIYPGNIAGAFQPKIRHVNGQTISYAPGDCVVRGTLTVNESFLRSIGDPISLVVLGNLNLPEVVPNDLLSRSLVGLRVYGRVRCHEENAEALYTLMGDSAGQPKMRIVPAGFELVERPLVLDNAMLESLSSSKLYCTDRIEVDPGADEALLDARIEGLASDDIVLCPAALRHAVAPKLATLGTRAVFYEGELWKVDDDQELVGSRFDFTQDKATLVVNGSLTIDPSIEPRVLADRLDKVHNFGYIECTREQMGAIQARLGISEGTLEDGAQSEDSDHVSVGNAGHLIL